MSIRDDIRARVDEGRLIEFVPRGPVSVARVVFLEPRVHCMITDTEDQSMEMQMRLAEVEAHLENFITGRAVTVAFGRRPKDVALRRLEPQKRGRPARTWEIRSTAPKPGYRLFGFFAEADVFVGVDLVDRDLVNFDQDIPAALTRWRHLFPTYEPLVSEDIHDYITENVARLRR